MKVSFFRQDEKIVSGITLKNPETLEHNNMALHVCENKEYIVQNRENLANTLGTKLEDFVSANQTHSANFYKVQTKDKGRGTLQLDTAIPNTDALYTFEANIVLCCFTADCVPVLFYNEMKNVIGIIHSGWQGTVKEITLKVFKHLTDVEQCDPNDFHVQIGPAISQGKFEVDRDVYEKFYALGYADDFIIWNEQTNKYHIDNQQTVMKQCERAGVPRTQIKLDPTCTFINTEGFSYREDKRAGRHLSFIMRKS